MANQYGVIVDRIDISEKMICLAKIRIKEEGLKNIIDLEKADCLEIHYQNVNDIAYSWGVFLHIKVKKLLFKNIFNALVSGGRLFFLDYCLSQNKIESKFKTYLHKRKYSLVKIRYYIKIL